MRKYDIISGLFLFILAIAICMGSLQLKIGTFTSPGSGFFPLFTGIMLGFFSVLILIEAIKLKKEDISFWMPNANKKAIYLTFLLILLYALLLERFGFIGTSLIFFLLISRLVFSLRWVTSIFFSIITSFGIYLIFKILLRAPLPKGIIERIF